MRTKKGQSVNLQSLVPIVITIAVAIIALGLMGQVSETVKETQCDGYYNSSTSQCWNDTFQNQTSENVDFNATGSGIEGMLNLSGQFGNIGTILAITIIIGLLVGAFAVFRN